MLPSFLVPEAVIREDGEGPVISVASSKGKLLLLTLGITRIIEQESLDVSVWGSPDGADWGTNPLVSFPQKFYCGTYQILLDLASYPDVAYLRAQWKLNRWGRGDPKPLFVFYLFLQEVAEEALAAETA